MLKVSVGEVPIVICISHEICTGHQKHGPSSYWGGGGLLELVKLCGARFNLQNDPLHDPQKVEDGHDAAEEDDDGQSLRKESKPLTSARRQRSSMLSNKSSTYLKSKDVVDQVPEHE